MFAVRSLLLVLVATSACLFEDPGPGALQADAETGLGTSTSTSTSTGTSTGTSTDTGTGTDTGTDTGTPTTGEPPPEQCAWEPRSPSERPPVRIDATLTHDEEHDQVLLYGGRVGPLGADLGDTWAFDGSKWKLLKDNGAPGPRRGHAAAWDGERKRIVLFGGEYGWFDTQFAGSTWTHDGKEWSEYLDDDAGPLPRAYAAMADLPAYKQVVLFGGRSEDGLSDETWAWDGEKWSRMDTAVAPSPRFDHTMALDEESGKVLLHGGCATTLCGEPLTDTWAWDGAQWTLLDAGEPPGPRSGGMAFNRSEPALLRFGEGEGWRWGEEAWSTAGPAPQALVGFVVAYHPGSAGLVLFGGLDAKLVENDETWVFRCMR